MNQNIKIEICEMCGRERKLTFHHFIPKTCHTNKWFKKNFSREEMNKRGAALCSDCHKFIHKTYTEKELGKNFNTFDKLMADPKILKFVKWVKKQK
jgi:hypothetical protein